MRTPTAASPRPQPHFACLPSHQVLDHVGRVLEPESLLSGPEVARAEALVHPGSLQDFVAARVLTRLLLRRWHDPDAELASIADIVLVQSCPRCGGPHGRPADALGLGVSWAHAGGFVAAAVGPGPVGVDVEPPAPARVDAQVQGLGDATSLRAWVRAEAIVKWGHGSVDDAVRWQPRLEGPPSPGGQRYRLDDEGEPHRTRLRSARAGVVVTDSPFDSARSVCSVAAEQPARWVNPLV